MDSNVLWTIVVIGTVTVAVVCASLWKKIVIFRRTKSDFYQHAADCDIETIDMVLHVNSIIEHADQLAWKKVAIIERAVLLVIALAVTIYAGYCIKY